MTAPTAAPATGAKPKDYLTPECAVGRTEPDFRFGCPKCSAPGYQHPVLGWMPVPCACACHTVKEES